MASFFVARPARPDRIRSLVFHKDLKQIFNFGLVVFRLSAGGVVSYRSTGRLLESPTFRQVPKSSYVPPNVGERREAEQTP